MNNESIKIDTSKKVRFVSDRGINRDETALMTEIIFENDELCLCQCDTDGIDGIILFNKNGGQVLTENFTCYYAENY